MSVFSAGIDQNVSGHRICIFNAGEPVRQQIGAIVLRVAVRCLHTEPGVISLDEIDALRTVRTVIIDTPPDHVMQPFGGFRLCMLRKRNIRHLLRFRLFRTCLRLRRNWYARKGQRKT